MPAFLTLSLPAHSRRITRVAKVALLFLALTAIIVPQKSAGQSAPANDDRLERLERGFRELQQRNAELEEKVKRLEAREASLAKEPSAPSIPQREASSASAKEQAPPAPPIAVVATTNSPDFEITLGGFIQTQVETGDVSAFEGRFPIRGLGVFGATEVKDRFRVRRSRLHISGDYADQLEFKLEGEFQLALASNSTRTGLPVPICS